LVKFFNFAEFFVLMKKYKKKEKDAEVIDSKDFVEVIGEVVELMPASSFKVLLPNGHEILTHLSGKMRMNRIRLLPGDRVKVQMSPYDLTKGRITFRM